MQHLSDDLLLDIKDLNFYYRLDTFKAHSFKDLIVSKFSFSFTSWFSPRENLHILKDINLEVYKGDRVGIIGVNGAGKTTLCRLMAKMLIPQLGSVKSYGEVRAIFNPSVASIPELTGRENAYLLAELLFSKLPKYQIDEIANEACEFSELGEFLDSPYNLYSKGMQVRLFLSVISAKTCDLLILDEIFDGADEFFQKKMAKRIKKIIEDSGASIMVSHSLDKIRDVCNRLLILDNSSLIFDGSVEEGIIVYKSLKN